MLGARTRLTRVGPTPAYRDARIDVSSTEISARLGGRSVSHGFVPDPVAAYIRDAGLYR